MRAQAFKRSLRLAALGLAVLSGIGTAANAKPARCFATDEGYFPCDFQATDRAGSFEISSPDTPTYSLVVDSPGFAYGYVRFGARSIPLAGMFVRASDDPACWNNPELGTKICAW